MRPGQRPAHSRRTHDILVPARFVFGKFPFVGWSRGWYVADTENNFDKMQNSQQIEQDIEKTIHDAVVRISNLVKESRYNECVLNRY